MDALGSVGCLCQPLGKLTVSLPLARSPGAACSIQPGGAVGRVRAGPDPSDGAQPQVSVLGACAARSHGHGEDSENAVCLSL